MSPVSTQGTPRGSGDCEGGKQRRALLRCYSMVFQCVCLLVFLVESPDTIGYRARVSVVCLTRVEAALVSETDTYTAERGTR